MNLKEFFTENKTVALGFSGGVDSSYLLYAALKYGAEMRAYYIKTVFQPEFEYNDALRMAEYLKADLKIIEVDILSVSEVEANPENRCYYCKKALFTTLIKHAEADGFKMVIDGNNASDDSNDRAGMKAVKELSVRSPLRECRLAKDEIRELSKQAGLFTWDKPAYACLATRVPSGMKITAEIMKKVENSEDFLFSLGFSDFRVRVSDKDTAKIQVKENQMMDVIQQRSEILNQLGKDFKSVVLDLTSR